MHKLKTYKFTKRANRMMLIREEGRGKKEEGRG
jgi:hypothetical protein